MNPDPSLERPCGTPKTPRRAAACALALLMLAGAFALPPNAQAQSNIPLQQVEFPEGKSGTALSGSLKGRTREARDYLLSGKAGQTMTVSLSTTSNWTYFNVLPPGSLGEAIFAGETMNQRHWTGDLPDDGDYVIRVFLNRAASRQGVSANYRLTVSLAGGDAEEKTEPEAQADGEPKYDETGQLPCSMGGAPAGSAWCDFGVKRAKEGEATVDVTPPGGVQRTLTFAGDRVKASGGGAVKASKERDGWHVSVNGYEHYVVPLALINGG